MGKTLVVNPGALRDGGYALVEDDGLRLRATLESWRDPK